MQHWGEYYRTLQKVYPNSKIHFPAFAIIHTITCSWEKKLQNNMIYTVSWGNLLQGYRAELRMIYCPCIFLQNRSKCSQWHTQIHMCTCAQAHLHTHWINLHSCLLFSLIYMVCEWLLNRVGSLVEELGNGPFLRTQWNRSRAAYVGIWMVNRWITQSGVFLCRLAGIV